MTEKEPAGGGERNPIAYATGAVWTIVASMVLALGIGVSQEARPGAETDIVTQIACQAFAYLLVVFAMLRVHEPESRIRDALGLRAVAPWAVPVALVMGALFFPAMASLDAIVEARAPLSTDEHEFYEKLLFLGGPAKRAFFFVGCTLLVPLIEQALFFGMIYGGVRRGRTMLGATLAVALYVVLAQGSARSVPTQLALALVLGWLRGRGGTSVLSAAAHCGYFVVPTLQLIVLGREATLPRNVTLGASAAFVLCACMLHVLLGRDARACRARGQD